jgi:hypothetical protein
MPFILAYSNILITLQRCQRALIITPARIGLMTVLCACVWELGGPFLKSTSVFDSCDFLAYACGSILYFVTFELLHHDSKLLSIETDQ